MKNIEMLKNKMVLIQSRTEFYMLYVVTVSMTSEVSDGAKIRNRYNQVPHLTQDTNGKVTNSQKTPQTRAKKSSFFNFA